MILPLRLLVGHTSLAGATRLLPNLFVELLKLGYVNESIG
jgi:hypothetical protein